MNNAGFGMENLRNGMENLRKYRDIKSVTANKRRNQLVSESNYHTTKWFSENLDFNRNEENKCKNESARVFKIVNIRH